MYSGVCWGQASGGFQPPEELILAYLKRFTRAAIQCRRTRIARLKRMLIRNMSSSSFPSEIRPRAKPGPCCVWQRRFCACKTKRYLGSLTGKR